MFSIQEPLEQPDLIQEQQSTINNTTSPTEYENGNMSGVETIPDIVMPSGGIVLTPDLEDNCLKMHLVVVSLSYFLHHFVPPPFYYLNQSQPAVQSDHLVEESVLQPIEGQNLSTDKIENADQCRLFPFIYCCNWSKTFFASSKFTVSFKLIKNLLL